MYISHDNKAEICAKKNTEASVPFNIFY